MRQGELVLQIPQWTDAPVGDVLRALAERNGRAITVSEGTQVRVIGTVKVERLEERYRPFWG